MVKKYRYITGFLLFILLMGACGSTSSEQGDGNGGTPSQNNEPISISTDKVAYNPGEAVTFTISRSPSSETKVRYKHLGEVIDQSSVTGTSWQWTPPSDDFTGYMVEIYQQQNGSDNILATIGIDVSSNWTKFPRYGFLSRYPKMQQSAIDSVIQNLNRYHINGLQFYDWHYKHHQPLAGTGENPDSVWKDISNTDVYFSTVSSYINTAHKHNIRTMFYNLIYGALDGAASDGVQAQWYLYTDQNHNAKKKFSLPSPPFKSDIYLLDPSNTGWQNYLIKQDQQVYEALDFDGYHMDQLGNQGTLYDYDGSPVNLAQTFQPFIESMNQANPNKQLVMNAVNQYGQSGIADAPTDFLYTEVWSPHDKYMDLAKIIKDNNSFGHGQKNSVLAAYVNYDMANQQGYFNTPSVLFTDAVIFAFGGDHLELGEHMLGKEYFPNDNLAMRGDLKNNLVSYYDFFTAYENLLRGEGTFNLPELSTYSELTLNKWPPQQGNVSVIGKKVGNREVIHLINFTDASTMNWRDNNGIQPYPYDQKDISLTFSTDKQVAKIWYATPDNDMGASKELKFTQSGKEVSFTLPFLKYWSMVVIEFK